MLDEMLYFSNPTRQIKKVTKMFYRGYKAAIVSSGTSPRCYVEKKDPEEEMELDVHGGINYTGEVESIGFVNCVGWDYSMANDLYYLPERQCMGGKSYTTTQLLMEIKTALDNYLDKPKGRRNDNNS